MLQVSFLSIQIYKLHILHCISQYLNFLLLSPGKNDGFMFQKERQIQILWKYSGRDLDALKNTPEYKQPLTLVHQKYSFRIVDLVCYQQKNLSKLWLETFTTTAFQYRLMKEMSLFRDKLSVQSNHSCMYYVVLRMILQLYKSILTSTQSRPFLGFHCSCATATFYNRFQLSWYQNFASCQLPIVGI